MIFQSFPAMGPVARLSMTVRRNSSLSLSTSPTTWAIWTGSFLVVQIASLRRVGQEEVVLHQKGNHLERLPLNIQALQNTGESAPSPCGSDLHGTPFRYHEGDLTRNSHSGCSSSLKISWKRGQRSLYRPLEMSLSHIKRFQGVEVHGFQVVVAELGKVPDLLELRNEKVNQAQLQGKPQDFGILRLEKKIDENAPGFGNIGKRLALFGNAFARFPDEPGTQEKASSIGLLKTLPDKKGVFRQPPFSCENNVPSEDPELGREPVGLGSTDRGSMMSIALTWNSSLP
jgi:hypothetical protein